MATKGLLRRGAAFFIKGRPMTHRLSVLLVVSAAFFASSGRADNHTIQFFNAQELADAFPTEKISWQIRSDGYGQKGSGEWQYAVSKAFTELDYSIEARFKINRPADQRDGLEMGAYGIYHAHAELGGYENAICVRYHGPQRHYRIAISSLWGELILWRPTGGVLQVHDFPFEVGKTYTLKVTCSGPRISVAIDGKQLIDWYDNVDPIPDGTVALAVKEGDSTWSALSMSRASAAIEPKPSHQPSFSERQWHGGRWFFDGQEPVFTLRENNVLDHMKLRPGYRAAMYAFNYVTDWNRFTPNKIAASRVLDKGGRLVLETLAHDPKSPAITCTSRLTVSYDAERGTYAYDHACSVNLPDTNEAALVAREWDHGDAVFLGSVGSAQTRDPKAGKPLYDWSIFEGPDATLCKVPHNHNGHYLAAESNNGGPVYPNGGRVIAVGDKVLSPVIQFTEKRPEFSNCKAGLCWWAYDVHTLFEPQLVQGALKPGTYTSKVRYTGISGSEGQHLLSQAQWYKPLDTDVRVPVFTAGVGNLEPFDKEVLLASPHTEHRIWGGQFDRQQGHGDRSSLRLDGASECWTLTGPSYFVSPYGKRNRVSVWIKMANVEGTGPTIGFRRLDSNAAEFHPLGMIGTREWTEVSYVTDFPEGSFGVMVNFRNCGRGTVWFDDFKVEPLAEDSDASKSPGPPKPSDSDVLLDYRAEHADTLLDRSGHNHHGKVYGNAKIVQEQERAALVLDGQSTYVWPLGTPELVIGPNRTLLAELKPTREGMLVAAGFQFTLSTVATGDALAVEYRPASRAAARSKPFLRLGQWQTLERISRTSSAIGES